jgi:hypothetical protein
VEDAQEQLLRVRRDEALAALGQANARATAAVIARNAARKTYDASVRALVSYRDARESKKVKESQR